jgi:hypothetical protein
MSTHADRAFAFKQAKKDKRTKSKQTLVDVYDANEVDAEETKLNAGYTKELEDAGYIVFGGYAAQYWQRATDIDALITKKIARSLKEAIAFFNSMNYDITDEYVTLPGCSDTLSHYSVMNLI